MEYKYITENNLENIQKYNYSQFCGDEFLQSYVQSRHNAISVLEKKAAEHNSFLELRDILSELQGSDRLSVEHKELAERYLKSFEVRKRLYSFYDENWRPSSESYSDYCNYIMLSHIVSILYSQTGNLKYLNCLMKVNDTILSLLPYMPESVKAEVKMVLEEELSLYHKCLSNLEV